MRLSKGDGGSMGRRKIPFPLVTADFSQHSMCRADNPRSSQSIIFALSRCLSRARNGQAIGPRRGHIKRQSIDCRRGSDKRVKSRIREDQRDQGAARGFITDCRLRDCSLDDPSASAAKTTNGPRGWKKKVGQSGQEHRTLSSVWWYRTVLVLSLSSG